MHYAFTLKYQLAADDGGQSVEQHMERLAMAGCDDATIGIGLPGRLALAFVRDGQDAWTALLSAIQAVRQAFPSAQLIEAGPDLVGLTDAAEVTAMSRQNMRKLMLTHTTDFPPPVHEGNPSVWHLADILDWLNSKGGYQIDAHLLATAKSAKQINLARAARAIEPDRHRQLTAWMA